MELVRAAARALLKHGLYIITASQWGSGVKAWNAHHFPTGSRAYKPTAPRPHVSTHAVGPGSRSRDCNDTKKNKSPKIITRGCRPRQGLLKTSDKHVLQFHFKKVSQKYAEILSNTFWSSLSGELCWFTGKTWRRKSSTHFTFLHRS